MERLNSSVKFVSLYVLILCSVQLVNGGPLDSYPSRGLACASLEPGCYDPSHPSISTKTSIGLAKRLKSSDPDPPRNSSFYPVTGVPGKVVERRPIGVLQRDYPDVFNMLLLAMEAFQSEDENADLGYNRIAGIHWVPKPWQYPPEATVNPGLGYCTHHSALFATWHRPYLIVFEHLLYETALKIADQFSGNDAIKYRAACDELRLPYWDWASDDTKSRMPDVTLQASIIVVKPASGPTNIPNPFYNYRFPASQVGEFGVSTVRQLGANDALFAGFETRKLTVAGLVSINSFNSHSSALESIHDIIHGTIGGHMGGFGGAPFDPIFWLHHCNVDRLLAIYQASHPGVYLNPKPRVPTLALGGPGPDDLSTPLFPFRHPNGKEWTSDDVKTADSIFEYGYAYPEVPVEKSNNDLKTFAIVQSRELFDPDTNGPSFKGADSGVSVPTSRLEWSCNVQMDMRELLGSYLINFYIGEYDKENPENYQKTDENFAGSAAIFSSLNTTARNPDSLLNITVPLTPKLVEKNISLRPDASVPILTEQLHWILEKVGITENEKIPVTNLKSLKVAVFSTIANYPEDETKLPEKSNPLTYYEPTTDKAGGLQPGEAPPVGDKAPQVLNGTMPRTNSTDDSTKLRARRLW